MTFNDNYEWLSGWIHDYYCDKDGSELIFDINNNKYFECPTCHYKYTDEKRKRAWVTKYRYKIFASLEDYSRKYLENSNPKILSYIIEALNYYSLNYDKFIIHDKNGEIYKDITTASKRCGRITAQGLNEAMISIQLVNCLDNVGSKINEKTRNNVFNLLFFPMYELLKPQINKIHNICCYEICAIAMMGIISNNHEMLDFAFSSPYSFYHQLDLGITSDFLWFEGSFHYHFFVLKPILELLKLAKVYDYDIPEKYYEIARKMLIQGFKCSFSDCSLPSPNDGWPKRHLSDYLYVYKLGNEIFKNEFSNLIESINNRKNSLKTCHFIDTGFSLLKNKYWNVFIKYKDNNLNHAHPDKLNIEIKCNDSFLTHDLSTSGYGSEISQNFYKKTYSHNTIVIDGKNQNLENEITSIIYRDTKINVSSKNIYDNTNISRKINLLSKKIIDKVIVDSSGDKNIDYFFHCDAKLLTKLDYNNALHLHEYPYLENVKEISAKTNNIVLKWKLEKRIITCKINLKNKQLFICKSPDNPNKKMRTTLMIRSTKNVRTIFKIKWKII